MMLHCRRWAVGFRATLASVVFVAPFLFVGPFLLLGTLLLVRTFVFACTAFLLRSTTLFVRMRLNRGAQNKCCQPYGCTTRHGLRRAVAYLGRIRNWRRAARIGARRPAVRC